MRSAAGSALQAVAVHPLRPVPAPSRRAPGPLGRPPAPPRPARRPAPCAALASCRSLEGEAAGRGAAGAGRRRALASAQPRPRLAPTPPRHGATRHWHCPPLPRRRGTIHIQTQLGLPEARERPLERRRRRRGPPRRRRRVTHWHWERSWRIGDH
eukprot:scaffold1503_cov150-Ochromonas_danica.AAC.18